MIYRVIKSAIFGIMMTLVMLISNKFKPAGSMPIWGEAIVRFIIYVIVYFLITLGLDYFRAKKNKGQHEGYKASE